MNGHHQDTENTQIGVAQAGKEMSGRLKGKRKDKELMVFSR